LAQTTLTHIIDEMKTLEPDELRQIERAARSLLEPQKASDEEQFLKSLQRSGLVNEIKRPLGNKKIERPLVPIQGKPLSETIVEERR